ncbi:MAG: glycosyltransferase family 39 protein [Candidatus Omnitrophica bacterium]|nr:glycosyltransferase family 39 protein [Candidatus Omnitrophota bacterium]
MKCFYLKHKNILFIIIFLGLILRLWSIKQNLPYNYYGDESYLIYHSLKFGTGDLNPHWFIWPTLFQYLLFFFFSIFYLLGFALSWFKGPADFLYLYFKDPTIFFLIGRITSAIFGTTSIYLVYTLTKKIYDKNTGLISAFIFSFLPLTVEYSHYAVTDTPVVFMILLSFVSIMNIFLYTRLKDYISSGILSGLAIGTKYPAGILILPIILAHLFSLKQRSFKAIFSSKLIFCFFSIFLGFFLSTPFAILDFSKFFLDIKGQVLCAKMGWFGWEKTNPYIYHLNQNLKNTLGFPLLFFSLISLIYIIIQREKKDLILISFPIIYFLLIGWNSNPYPRFMLPVLPFFAIFSGKLLSDLKDWKINKGDKGADFLFFCLLVFLFFNPIYSSIRVNLSFSLPNTMTLAKEWVEKNIPKGSKILLNEYGPPLIQSPKKNRIESESKPKELLRYGYHRQRDLFYKIKERVSAEGINYELTYIPNPIGYLENESGYEWLMKRMDEAINDYQNKYDFVIISDALLYKIIGYPREYLPKRYFKLRDFYKEILNNYQPIKVFSPQKNAIIGPTIRIYKLR